jgi:hypothetical protein
LSHSSLPLAQELTPLLGPDPAAFEQLVFLLVVDGTALRELGCERIDFLGSRSSSRRLILATSQWDCTGADGHGEEQRG